MKCGKCGESFEGLCCPNCREQICIEGTAPNTKSQKDVLKIPNSDLSIVESHNLKGVIDEKGNIIIPIEYDSIRYKYLVGGRLGSDDYIEFLKDFSLICAEKYGEVYIYNIKGELVYHYIGSITHDYWDIGFVPHDPILLLKNSRGKYSLFNMISQCEILSGISHIGHIMRKYRYIPIDGSLNIYDKESNMILSIKDATSIEYDKQSHVLIADDRDGKNCKIYDTSLKYLGALPKGIRKYDISHIVSQQYFLCSEYFSEYGKSLYGVYDIKANEWKVPMGYLEINYDETNNQFRTGSHIQELIMEKEHNELEDRKRKNKNRLIGAILISLGIIGLIVFFITLPTDNILLCILLLFFFIVSLSLGIYRLCK